MYKILIMFLLFTMLAGCQRPIADKQSESKEIELDQETQNIFNEDLELLAIKYGVNKGTLKNTLIEYEKMTTGFSLTEATDSIWKSNSSDDVNVTKQEIVETSSAIAQLSQKYQIQEQTLSAIIIDKKMIEPDRSE